MTIEVSAKKVDDAIAQGLEQLGASIDDVTVEVLESGGLFRKAKVRLTLETGADKAAEKEQAEENPKKEQAEQKPKDGPSKAAEKPVPSKTEKPIADGAASGKREEKESAAVKSADSAKDKAMPQVKANANAKAKSADEHKKVEKVSKNEYAPTADMPAVKKSNELSARSTESENPPEAESKKPQQKHAHAKDKAADKQSNAAKEQDAESSGAADTDKCTAPDTERSAKKRLRAEDREAAAHALEFVEKAVALMGLTAQVSADADVEHIDITAPEGDDSLIIGRHGETLSALTYLAETVARAEKCHINLVVDCNGYRARRAASLTAMARRRAHECASKHRRIKLEPMDRVDRRTIHCALSDDEYVTTESEGKEPYRYVVIVPKNGEVADDDRHGNRNRRDRRDRGRKDGAKPSAGEKPRRAAFDVNLHGFVGHNDHAEDQAGTADENSTASAKPQDDAE